MLLRQQKHFFILRGKSLSGLLFFWREGKPTFGVEIVRRQLVGFGAFRLLIVIVVFFVLAGIEGKRYCEE